MSVGGVLRAGVFQGFSMYVCVCHAVTSKQLASSIAQGATTFKALRQELGVATCCGKCGHDVRVQLRETGGGAVSGKGDGRS